MAEEPRNTILILGFLIAVLIPATVVAAVVSEMRWYHGLSMFYAALSLAEIGYVAILLVMDGPLRSAWRKAAT